MTTSTRNPFLSHIRRTPRGHELRGGCFNVCGADPSTRDVMPCDVAHVLRVGRPAVCPACLAAVGHVCDERCTTDGGHHTAWSLEGSR